MEVKFQMNDKRERKNTNIFLLFTVVSGIAANICSEGYIQAYLIRIGFDTDGIRDYGLVIQTVAVAAYLMFTRLPPVKNGLKAMFAAAVFCSGIFPAVLAVAGYIPSFAAIYTAVLIAAASYGFLTAFRAVAENSMVPYLFSRSLYGDTVGKAMIAGGIITVCISAGFLFGQDGVWIYTALFCVSAATLFISAFLVSLYRFQSIESEKPPTRVMYSDIFKKILSARYMANLAPHFLRGAGMAGMYYIVPSVLENIGLSDADRSFLIVVSVVSTMAGSFIFMRLNKKIKSGVTTFAAILLCSVLMPILVLCTEKYLFFALYFVFCVFGIISSVSIPTGVLRSTPDDELPLVTSMRFLLMSIASSLFIFIFGVLLKYIAAIYIMVFSGAVFVLCGFLYKRQFDDRL